MRNDDAVAVTTVVAVDRELAFQVFTEQVDTWWRKEPRFRFGGPQAGRLRFDPGPPRRLVERREGGAADEAAADFEVGRVLVWEPPARLVFTFRTEDFAQDEATEVDVRFDEAPAGTRVTLVHRGWSRIPLDHPARRKMGGGPAFDTLIGGRWAELLTAFARRAGGRAP